MYLFFCEESLQRCQYGACYKHAKSTCYKGVSAMLSNEEKKRAKVNSISNMSPLFEDFLCFFLKTSLQVHINFVYIKMCEMCFSSLS